MAIKVIIGKVNKKNRKCLRCNKQIERVLRDNTVYTCEHCGQQHLVDVYANCIALTVAERPDVRKRRKGHLTPEQEQARERRLMLIEKVETRRNQ